MKKLIVMLALAAFAAGAQTKTPIRDTLLFPNGAPFNGVVTLEWSAFRVAGRTVVGGKIDVPVKNGVIRMELEPNDAAQPAGTSYKAFYAMSGKPYTEYWVVPTSATPVSVAQIRTDVVPAPGLLISLGQLSTAGATPGQVICAPSGSGGSASWCDGGSGGGTGSGGLVYRGAWSAFTPYALNDVVQRLGGSYVAIIPGTNHAPESSPLYWSVLAGTDALSIKGVPVADGVPTDGQMMRYNVSTQQWERVTLVDMETPEGVIDGANAAFTLANAPAPSNGLMIFRNGLVQKPGGFDYTLTGNTITFVEAAIPQPGDTLLVWYRY